MPDNVIDIVHKLTYESQTAPIDKATEAIQKEIASIDKQAASIARLEALRASTDKSNIMRIGTINAAIDNRKRKIEQETVSITKQIQANEQLGKTLARQGVAMAAASDKLDRLSKAGNSANLALVNVGRIAQDLPFGFLGISNNLNPLLESFQRLKVETGSSSAALKALGASLIGAGGLGLALSIISGLLVVFGDDLLSMGGSAGKAEKEVEGLTAAMEKLINTQLAYNKNLAETSANGINAQKRVIDQLEAQGDQEGKLYEARKKLRETEIAELKKDRELFNDIQSEFINNPQIPFNTLGAEFNEQLERIRKEGGDISEYIIKQQGIIDEKILDKQNDLEVQKITFTKESIERAKKAEEERKRASEEAYKNALEDVENQNKLNLLNDEALKLERGLLQSEIEINLLRKDNRVLQGLQLKPEEQKIEDEEFNSSVKRLEAFIKIRELLIEKASEEAKAQVAETFNKPFEAVEFKLKAEKLDIETRKAIVSLPKDSIQTVTTGDAQVDLNEITDTMKAARRGKSEIESLSAVDKDKNKENVKARKEAIDQITEYTLDAIQTILDAQIRALDKEIEIREERVNQATALAERGNTEVLRLETERLQAAQRERENTAQKEIQLNALITASNQAKAVSEAIGAVVSAAAKGDPYTIALRIAAAVAALVAGIATIKGAFSSPQGFAEGGYTGDGDKFQPAGVVHKGEFVMTKEKTAQFRPLLEAIHDGKLAVTADMPGRFGGGNDTKLYKKVDELIAATEGNYVKVQQTLDQYGLSQVVETARRQQRRMWGG